MTRLSRTTVYLIAVAAAVAGCVRPRAASIPPSTATEVLLAFSATRGPTLALAPLTATDSNLRALRCRQAGEVGPPNQMTFAQYVEGALRDQLTIAPGLSSDSPLRLTAHLDSVLLRSWPSGLWSFVVTFGTSGGDPFIIRAEHAFETPMEAVSACRRAAGELGGAMRELLAQLVTHSEFQQLLRSGAPPSSSPRQ